MGTIPHYTPEKEAQILPMQKEPFCNPSTDPDIYIHVS